LKYFLQGVLSMSSMLEQAIVDAEALKEAAIKTQSML
jgi:hypothetical protein